MPEFETTAVVIKTRGANTSQQNQIRTLAAMDYTAEEISDMVRVELKCVLSFVKAFTEDAPEEEPKEEPKKKVAKKKVAKKKVAKKED